MEQQRPTFTNEEINIKKTDASRPKKQQASNEDASAALQFPLPYLTSSEEEDEQEEVRLTEKDVVVDVTGFKHLEYDDDEDILMEYSEQKI